MVVSPDALNRLYGHPRLFANAAAWEALSVRVKTDPVAAKMYEIVKKQAMALLPKPVMVHEKEGYRLLGPIRVSLGRILFLSMVARIDNDDRYVTRAVAEMRAAALLPDWNPSHFLDTAEMTLALAIGYDWLYDRMNPADRARIELAIVEKGLRISLESAGREWRWIRAVNNWGQVCHAGLVAGALAVASKHPELALTIIQRAIDHLPLSAKAYAPDGVYPEGPMYWGYGTSFHVMLIDMLEQALGSTYGLEKFPGFMESTDFMMMVTAPSGLFFNFADCRPVREFYGEMFWFARRRRLDALVASELELLDNLMAEEGGTSLQEALRLFPLALFWWDSRLMEGAKRKRHVPPLDWMGRGENPVAVHRSAWGDPKALYIGIKGGSPGSNHAHMDAGSFVLEADGIRWAVDLGMQEYHSLESVGVNVWNFEEGGVRWKVFRTGPEAHNIIRFNGASQWVAGHAEVTEFQGGGATPHTTIDLTPLYPDHISCARRRITMRNRREVLIEDEWTAGAAPLDISWQWLTYAEVVIRSHSLELRQEGRVLTLNISAPDKIGVEVEDVSKLMHPYDAPNPGLRRIVLRMSSPAGGKGRLAVLVRPGKAKNGAKKRLDNNQRDHKRSDRKRTA